MRGLRRKPMHKLNQEGSISSLYLGIHNWILDNGQPVTARSSVTEDSTETSDLLLMLQNSRDWNTSTQSYAHICLYMFLCVFVYTCLYVCLCVCVCMPIFVCICVCGCGCFCVSMFLGVCFYIENMKTSLLEKRVGDGVVDEKNDRNMLGYSYLRIAVFCLNSSVSHIHGIDVLLIPAFIPFYSALWSLEEWLESFIFGYWEELGHFLALFGIVLLYIYILILQTSFNTHTLIYLLFFISKNPLIFSLRHGFRSPWTFIHGDPALGRYRSFCLHPSQHVLVRGIYSMALGFWPARCSSRYSRTKPE